jgi:hypothetical protein
MFDEEDIFSLVFGFRPRLYEYVRSPFRSDSSPGCFFTISPSGRLRFVDFANKDVVYGIKMSNMDCFDAVQTFFKLPNFYLALRFIERNLTKGGKRRKVLKRGPRPVKEKVEMLFQGRNFVRKDAEFWSPYGISRVNLLEDNVFPVSRILMRNTRNGDVDTLLKETCYAYTGFEERIKFYFPYRKGRGKFVTNCTMDDIGHLDRLPPYGRQLIYTKSYKDRRVLVNSGRYSVWNQNEGMEPSDDVLFPMVKRFDSFVILYDNDAQGIKASLALAQRVNAQFPHRARPLWIPEHLLSKGLKDPSDLRKHSLTDYNEFLKHSLI